MVCCASKKIVIDENGHAQYVNESTIDVSKKDDKNRKKYRYDSRRRQLVEEGA